MKNRYALLMILAIFALSLVTMVAALPTGPEYMNKNLDGRYSTFDPLFTQAIAGNVSRLYLNTSTITRTWQGYYGNVTGRIVLGDSNNNTLYDWDLATPQGEIYAVRSNGVPDWPNIRCATLPELQAEDTTLNVNETWDEDAVNRTFLYDFTHPLLYVGSVTVNEDDCAGVGLYDENQVSSYNFKEIMLSDGTADLVYTAFLSNTMNFNAESTGFDGTSYDFEMIVGEDGHGTNTATSDYYFYLQLS